MAAQPPYGGGGGGGVPSPSPRGSGGASGGGDFSIEGGGAGGGGSSRPRSYLSSVPLVQPAAASRVFRSGYSNVFTVPKHRAGGTQDATGSSNSQAKQPPRRPRGGLGAGAGTYAPPAAAAPPRPRVAPSMANSPNLPPGLAKYGLMPIGEEESLGTSLASSGGSSFNSSIDKSGTTADDLESALQRVAQERERIEQSIAAERVEYDVHRAEVRRRLASVASDHCVAVTASGPGSAKARRLAADVATLAEQLRQEEALSMAQLAREREKWEELLSLEREAAELRLYAMRVELLEAEEAEAAIRKHGAGASVTMSAETTAMMQQLKQMRRQLRRQIAAAADSGSSTSRSKADSEDSVAHREAKNYARVSSDAANLLLHGPLRSKSHRVGKLVTKASLEGDRPPSPELTPTEAAEASTAIDRKLQEAGGLEKLLNANTTGAGVATAAAGNDPPLAMSRRFWTSSRNPNVEPEPATRQEVEAYAVYLGMDIEADRDLLWIAEKALTAPLPSGWVEYLDPEGKEFFYHRESNISSYEHPMDDHFRELYAAHRAKNAPPGAVLNESQVSGGFSRKLRGLPSGLITAARGLPGGRAPLTISKRFWSSSRNKGEVPEPPTRDEIEEYATYLGMNIMEDGDLLWIAEKALTAPLPDGWIEYLDVEGKEFFWCKETNVSSYEHPMDREYRAMYAKHKARKGSSAY